MKYSELLEHCNKCATFLKRNNIKSPDENGNAMAVFVRPNEIHEAVNDPVALAKMPFLSNIDPTKDMRIGNISVVPVESSVLFSRYGLRYENTLIPLSDIDLVKKEG